MAASAEAMKYFESTRGKTMLWTGVLAGPLLWFTHQQVSLLLVRWACAGGGVLSLHIVTLCALLLTLGTGALAWRSWRWIGPGGSAEDADVSSRSRFMSLMGIFSSGLFGLLIIAQGIPNFILNPCHGWSA